MWGIAASVLILASVAFGLPENYKLPELKDGGVHWAVLVAGSNSWMNYRHQADVCHAYQIMKKHGLPDERIIVMMVDDIAHNKENPKKGIIINQPGGEDVYAGVVKDYTGLKEVVPEVFLDVIQGNEENLVGIGSGKVLKRWFVCPGMLLARYLEVVPLGGSFVHGPNDNVFINFVDHGAPGLIAFGNKYLHSKELSKALTNMHENHKYNKLLIYVETCEAGSMFKTLLRKDFNILAVTAANATQPSFACYFDKERKTFLGDLFSVNWMQNADKNNLNSETIDEQYNVVKKETNKSHVMEYGDLTMNSLMLADFMGKAQSNHIVLDAPDANRDAVPSDDVDLAIQRNLYLLADTKKEREESLAKMVAISKKRHMIDGIIKHIVSYVVGDGNYKEQSRILMGENELQSTDCYIPVIEHLKDTCVELELPFYGYSLKQLRTMVNLCERPFSVDRIMSAIDKVCA